MLSSEEINEIAAKQALTYVYDEAVLDLENVYHKHQKDGINSSSFYDLYCQIVKSREAELHHIEDGEFAKIGDSGEYDYGDYGYQIHIVDDFEESPIYALECLFEASQNALHEAMNILASR